MNTKDLPRFGGGSVWKTQRVIGYFGCETVGELAKKIREGDVFLADLVRLRGIGAEWVKEFVKEYALTDALNYFNKYSVPSKRIHLVKEVWSGWSI